MRSKATTVKKYLEGLPPDRRAAISKVRAVIRKHLPKGYEEGVNWGMITYTIPLSRFPTTYNGQPLCYAGLASQKNYMVLHLMSVYGDNGIEKWFREGFKARGKKLDMGKACVRFKTLDDLPLDLIGETIARVPADKWIAVYENSRSTTARAAN